MIRDIKIKAVLNGYSVNVGCQTLVFTSVEALVSALQSYLKDPNGQEKQWLATGLNAKHTLEPGSLDNFGNAAGGGGGVWYGEIRSDGYYGGSGGNNALNPTPFQSTAAQPEASARR